MSRSFRLGASRATRSLHCAAEPLEIRALLAAAVVPLPVTGIVASGTSASSISLSWDASSDPTVTGYNVIEKVWVPGGYKTQGHWSYPLRASSLVSSHDVVSGLSAGSAHTFFVTAINSVGQSLYSIPVVAQTWAAPKFTNSPSMFLLSSGAFWSGDVDATAGLTTQVKLLISGNPLTYSLVSASVPGNRSISAATQLAVTNALVLGGSAASLTSLTRDKPGIGYRPASDVSIDPQSGVITYTPNEDEVGTVSFTFLAANALGSVTQTIQFNVTPRDPLAIPTIRLDASSSTFNGQYQPFSATAIGVDGVTPVSGTVALAFNGTVGNPRNVGAYQVLVTFTSADPDYSDATLLSTVTMDKAASDFAYLNSPTIAQGSSTTTLSGYVELGEYASPVSANVGGEYVIVTLNGVSQAAPIGTSGNFSSTFDTSGLAVGDYAVSFAYAGDSNHFAATDGAAAITVIPTAPPQVTQNPHNAITSAGDGVSFTATATGTPDPTVQWHVSTDGGNTWANVTSNASATSTTLIFTATIDSQNGYRYRAVFSNYLGTAITSPATLTIEPAD